MDEFIQKKVDGKEECKPSSVYDEFMEFEENKLILAVEKTRLNSFGMEDEDVLKKFKKTTNISEKYRFYLKK